MEMTVEQLRSILEGFPPDKPVLIAIGRGGFWTVVDFMTYDGFPVLCALEPGK